MAAESTNWVELAAQVGCIAATPIGLWVLLEISKLRAELVEKIHRVDKRVAILEAKEKHS